MNCPSCNMHLTMSDRHGVEIDYCPQCRGVWLDRGELDKIIERAAALDRHHEGPQRFEPRYDSPKRRHDSGEYRRYDDDDEYKKHKRKSFLGDLFDF